MSPQDGFLITSANWIFHINIGGFEPTTHQQLFIVSLVFEILLFPAILFPPP
jgi:hypothetical protein